MSAVLAGIAPHCWPVGLPPPPPRARSTGAVATGRVDRSSDALPGGRIEQEQAVSVLQEVGSGASGNDGAAAAALPLTRRLTARRVQFITGHGESGALPEDLNMAALADPTATTVVYMGRRTFAGFAARLIEAGLPPSTPALLAEAVSTPDQKLSRHTVESLAHLPLDPATSAPALILYGPLTE